jgi:hypothetical protein
MQINSVSQSNNAKPWSRAQKKVDEMNELTIPLNTDFHRLLSVIINSVCIWEKANSSSHVLSFLSK